MDIMDKIKEINSFLKISIEELLKNSKLDISFESEDVEFLDDSDIKKIKGDFSVSFIPENFVIIEGEIIYSVNKVCEKCLETFDCDVVADLNIEYEISMNQKEIDITNDIKEEFWLNIPFLYKCSENCKGLCSVCGINLNKENCNCHLKNDEIFNETKKEKNVFKDAFKGHFLNKYK